MKNTILTLLIFITFNSIGQIAEKLKKLFDKKWSIETYEIAGQNIQASDVGKDDYTIFYSDNRVKSNDRGNIHYSKWKFNSELNLMTLYSDSVKVTTEMKIINLTDTEFVWETMNPEGITMTIHMHSKKTE